MMTYLRLLGVKKINTTSVTKVCANCKFWLIDYTEEQPQCKRFLSFNREEEIFRYEYSKIARRDEKLCGIKGKSFTSLK